MIQEFIKTINDYGRQKKNRKSLTALSVRRRLLKLAIGILIFILKCHTQ